MNLKVRPAVLIIMDLLPINTVHTTGQPEITNLDRAVIVDKDIARLQVPMDDLRLVKVAQAAEDVIDD